ncbi:Signal peptidase-like protein [Rhodocaloribacter litoris]|uniref:PSP1 domain-containing protein n=1 Tax=Rhodocaloribacter litoris TaxID=2558931 RepID=UPI0014212743|nr:regulatory iron-sulfur-containing complex subunit RicT [Rhodocaloribacter litoris]QXD16616.1 Signal peptidase-like protein [Rhodocaloribacter litoris]
MPCGSGGCGGGGCSGSCGSSGCGTCPALHVYDWLPDLGISGAPVVYEVVEVAFKGNRRGFYRNVHNLDLHTGDYVIVEADRGVDFGAVHMVGELVRLRLKSKGLDEQAEFPNVVRMANLHDIEQWETNKEEEAETFLIGRRAIERMNLPMKLVDVEWQFDHKKVTFYFTAEHRVDFRALVRELARRFRTRVELRQIGARDEAARIGGIGSCGRELCCSTWLQSFKPVTTQSAKVQNLPLNPVRLSGQCGRLKCCLNYELEQYMQALEAFPAVGTQVQTAQGPASVQKVDIFKDLVWIQYEDGSWEDKPLAMVKEWLVPREQDDTACSKRHDPNRRGKRRRGRRRGKNGSSRDD